MTQDVQRNTPELRFIAEMFADLDTRATAMEEASDNAALQIVETILSAETEEDLFRAQAAGTISGKDYTLRPFRMSPNRIDWRRSREAYIDNGGFPFFFFANVIDMETGNSVVINCGGKTIVAMVWKLCQLGAFDRFEERGGRPLMFQGNAALSGYEYLTIVPVADPLESVAANGDGNSDGGRKTRR